MGASHLPTPSSDSPTQHHLHNLHFGQQQNDQLSTSGQQLLYSNSVNSVQSQYSNHTDQEMQAANGPSDGSYRNNAVFGPYNGGRPRQNTIQTSSFMVDNNPGPFSPFQPSATDGFAAQSGSMAQQQLNGMRSYEYMNEQPSKSIFSSLDPFGANVSNSSSLLPSHQVNKMLQQQQQQLSNLQSQAMMNGLIQSQSAHSQTPFGPHVSSSGAGLSMGSVVSITNNQEEISTIFVVGFPDDMQEREFQNMFTFSPGFEAATLKIPNKELTAYGGSAVPPPPSSSSMNGRGGVGAGFGTSLGYPFNSANDPYNLVTVNQGGVVVDGRDGTTSSWPATSDTDFQAGALSMMSTNPNGGSATAPRKQIIGFAKFRSRAEALAARDLLQGRRVDIEKGAVLKAEMAKKNLHTKRGVGPLMSTPMSIGGNSGPNGVGSGMNGLPDGMSSVTSMLSPVNGPGSAVDVMNARERELASFGAGIGMSGLSRRERGDRFETLLEADERESRRRRETVGALPQLSSISSVNGMAIQRGPRERLEEDERERERRRKEKEMFTRMRQNTIPNLSAYESTFHTLRSSGGSMSAGNTLLSPTSSTENAIGNGSGYPFPMSPQEANGSSVLDSWQQASSVSPASASVASQSIAGLRNKIGSLNIHGALHALTIPGMSNGGANASASTSGIPTRPPSSSLGSTNSSADGAGQDNSSYSAANLTIRASTTPQGGDFDTGASQSASSLTSNSSISSLGSRSRPYSPSNEGSATAVTSSGFLPNLDLQHQQHQHQVQQFQQFHSQHNGQLVDYPSSVPLSTSSSSASVDSSSSNSDEELIGNPLNMMSSPHGTVSPQLPSPNSGSGSSSGTRSFNTSDHNPPINTLYVGNLPTVLAPGVSTNLLEENLRSLFSRCAGFRKLCFRQKANGLMCFVEFEDVAFATKAMQELSGNPVRGLVKGGIRLSYSKNQLGVRTPPGAAISNPPSQNLSRQHNNALPSFVNPGSYSSMQEVFQNPRQPVPGVLQVDTNALRNSSRRAEQQLDNNSILSPSYSFTTSPPPRFFSPDSSGYGAGYSSSSAHSIHNLNNLSRSASQNFPSTTFSPFESSTPPSSTPHLEVTDPMAMKSPSPNLDTE